MLNCYNEQCMMEWLHRWDARKVTTIDTRTICMQNKNYNNFCNNRFTQQYHYFWNNFRWGNGTSQDNIIGGSASPLDPNLPTWYSVWARIEQWHGEQPANPRLPTNGRHRPMGELVSRQRGAGLAPIEGETTNFSSVTVPSTCTYIL